MIVHSLRRPIVKLSILLFRLYFQTQYESWRGATGAAALLCVCTHATTARRGTRVTLNWSIDRTRRKTLGRLLPHRLLRYAARACCIVHAHKAETVLMAFSQAIHGECEFGAIGQFCDLSKISIDIGAAEGLYLYVLQKRSAACVGFEPNPLSYQHLKRCFSGVRLESCALSSAS